MGLIRYVRSRTSATARVARAAGDKFYYQTYFEWNLPTRKFIQVNIETNTVCTRKCHFCLYGIKDEVPTTRMPAALFFKIIDQLAEMKFSGRLSLFNINEPLTDKRIFDFLYYSRVRLPDAYHFLVSNGDLLTEERVRRLFASGLEQLMINSYDEESLKRNLALIDVLGPLKERIVHTDRTTYTEWQSRAGHVGTYFKEPVSGFCDLPNYVLYIKPDGKVLSCCNDFDSANVMGDLSQQGVRAVWFGKEYSSFRRRLNSGDRSFSALCSGCDYKANLEYFRWNDEVARGEHRIARDGSFPTGAEANAEALAIRDRLMGREGRRGEGRTVPIIDVSASTAGSSGRL